MTNGIAGASQSPTRRRVLTFLYLAVAPFGAGCDAPGSGSAQEPAQPIVTRHFLSGSHDDWEPSLAVGADGSVYIVATRMGPSLPGPGPFGRHRAVVWHSRDGGETFGEPVQPSGDRFDFDGMDPRIGVDQLGNVYASWISGDVDSASGGPDMGAGGLVVATSRDHGRTYQTQVVATFESGVSDKPELAVSSDGDDLYLAFMGAGTLDMIMSHDGGMTWERSTMDSTMRMYWPSSIALGAGDALYVTEPWYRGERTDSIVPVSLRLLRSTDRGSTWQDHVFSRSPTIMPNAERGIWCVHEPPCPLDVPYAGVAVDARNTVYVVYTEGAAKEPRDLRFIRSDDRGVTWSEPTILSAAPRSASGDQAAHYYPMVAAAGDGLVYVVWTDDRAGPLNVWAKRSADGGMSWSSDVQLTPAHGMKGFYGDYGGIAIDPRGTLHVAWGDGVKTRPGLGGDGVSGSGVSSLSSGPNGGVWYARWAR